MSLFELEWPNYEMLRGSFDSCLQCGGKPLSEKAFFEPALNRPRYVNEPPRWLFDLEKPTK